MGWDFDAGVTFIGWEFRLDYFACEFTRFPPPGVEGF